MNNLSNIKDALDYAISVFKKHEIENPKLSAEILLSEVSGINRILLYNNFEHKLNLEQQNKFLSYIYRRKKHEPIQYILGYAYFRDLKIEVGPGVLIPRPETEQLVDLAINNLNVKNPKILEIGTGSACIACSLAKEIENCKVVATENSSEALSFAKKNISNFNLEDRINLIHTNLADNVHENNFDSLISNPPYVPSCVIEKIDKEVKNYEPLQALDAGKYGLDYLKPILNIAKEKLKCGSFICLEIFEDSVEMALDLIKKEGLYNVQAFSDLAGKKRFILSLLA